MITTLKKILGIGPSVNFSELIQQGALIIDVRSKAEFNAGHIKGAINIPVNALHSHLGHLKDKNQPIIHVVLQVCEVHRQKTYYNPTDTKMFTMAAAGLVYKVNYNYIYLNCKQKLSQESFCLFKSKTNELNRK